MTLLTSAKLKELREKWKKLNSCHFITLELRRDGQTIREEGDWLKTAYSLFDYIVELENINLDYFKVLQETPTYRERNDDLLKTLEKSLAVVEAAKVFVKHNSVVHPQFTKALEEALAPFLSDQS